MRTRLNKGRMLLIMGAVLLWLSPTSALAHENVGGDEYAVANWMLIGAIITIILGVLFGVWAMKTGQFNNIEESKYRMIEQADDYDAIMREADELEIARAAVDKQPSAGRPHKLKEEKYVPS